MQFEINLGPDAQTPAEFFGQSTRHHRKCTAFAVFPQTAFWKDSTAALLVIRGLAILFKPLKGYVAFVRFLGIRTPPYMEAQKSFFCVKFPKTKPKTIFFSPKRLFQVFRLSTREMSFSNLALFENAQNLRDKF